MYVIQWPVRSVISIIKTKFVRGKSTRVPFYHQPLSKFFKAFWQTLAMAPPSNRTVYEGNVSLRRVITTRHCKLTWRTPQMKTFSIGTRKKRRSKRNPQFRLGDEGEIWANTTLIDVELTKKGEKKVGESSDRAWREVPKKFVDSHLVSGTTSTKWVK